MGRYSSDDSDSRGRKRRSSSRSYDRSDSKERTSHRKSKHRHHSPSRSSRQRRSQSSSSEESSRTSQSRNARRIRQSDSRDRSRSSHNRTSGPKHKHRSSRRSSSRSGSVSRSRHSFHSKSKRSRSRSSERMVSAESDDSRSQSSCKPASLRSEQGLDYLSNAVKAEAKLQMAIKAAAAADETLKSRGHLATSVGKKCESFEDQQKRANAIEEIDSGGFTQSTFRSTRNEIPMPKGSVTDASHAGAMFGGSMLVIGNSKKLENISQKAYSLAVDQDSFMHPYLFVTCEEKMDRWKKKLTEMREIRLQETGGKIP